MSQQMMEKILIKHLGDLKQRDGLKGMTLDLDNRAKRWLISRGISPEYGARLLARVIQTELLNPLARAILETTVKPDGIVLVRVNDNDNGLMIRPSTSI